MVKLLGKEVNDVRYDIKSGIVIVKGIIVI